MTGLRNAFAGLSIAWALSVPISAFAAGGVPSKFDSSRGALVWVVYRAGSVVCHQRVERSFSLRGMPLPVCARCTGIYAGAAFISVFVLFRDRLSRARRPADDAERFGDRARGIFDRGVEPRSPRRRGGVRVDPRVLLTMSLVPTAVTLIYEWTTGQMPAHTIRAATGALLGAAIGWIVIDAASSSGRGNVIH